MEIRIRQKVWICSCKKYPRYRTLLKENKTTTTNAKSPTFSSSSNSTPTMPGYQNQRNCTPAPGPSSKQQGRCLSVDRSKPFVFSPTRSKPRLKTPNPKNPSWSTRNRSNILPSHMDRNAGSRPPPGRRVPPPARRWPWQERAARSEVFPAGTPRPLDPNNNPTRGLGLQPRERWPWQDRGRTSAEIFQFGPGAAATAAAPPPTTSRRPKWPWQERAQQSLIFNLPEVKVPIHQRYVWDQRRTAELFEVPEPTTTTQSARNSRSQKSWPWQVRGRDSLIFKPLAPKEGIGMVYPWDQRQTIFDDMIDPDAKFGGVSLYNEEFVKKTNSTMRSIPSAGIKCYEGEIGDGPPNQGRRQHARKHFPDKANAETVINKDQGNQGLCTEHCQTPSYFYHVEQENSENYGPSCSQPGPSRPYTVGGGGGVDLDHDPARTKTFTVLQDASNFNSQNVRQGQSSNQLEDQFAGMVIKRENDAVKKIASMTVEPRMDGPRGRVNSNSAPDVYGQPVVINVSD